jgi:hypothetical protein
MANQVAEADEGGRIVENVKQSAIIRSSVVFLRRLK